MDKLGQVLVANDQFLLVISYNPGYQSAVKDLKHSTRQRFVALEFTYPELEAEAQIVEKESGCTPETAMALARLGEKIRHLRDHGLQEGVSTRLLIYAGKMIAQGIPPRRACEVSVVWALTDDQEVQRSAQEVVFSIFE